jgi:hypothetical protein
MIHRFLHKTRFLFITIIGLLTITLLVWGVERRATAESHPHAPTANPPLGWTVECVDCLRYFTGMSGSSAALDSNGRVQTTYGGDGLYYATENPDGTFQTEVVDPNPNRGINATMVLDSSNRPHILYYAGDLLRLNYAYHDGAQWYIESLPTADLSALPHPWLVIDDSDNLHVAFNHSGVLTYGFYDHDAWQITPVDSPGSDNVVRPSLALDSNGRPHIAYGRGGKYASFDGVDWLITTFAGTYVEGESIALALDGNDHPHIVYQTEFDGHDGYELRYRHFDGTGWQLENVEDTYPGSIVNHGFDISLTLDASDRPIVVYTAEFSSGHPYPSYEYYISRVAYREPTGWEIQNLFSSASSLYDTNYNTLLSGPDDNLIVVYKDGFYLKSSILAGETITTAVIDQGGSTGTHIDMVVDSQDRLHLSAHEAEDDRLRYGLREDEVWSVETPFVGAGFVGSDWTSLALTNDSRPFIMIDHYSRIGSIAYVFYDGHDWVHEENDQYYDSIFRIGMDSSNNVHTAFIRFTICCAYTLGHLVRDPSGSWSDLVEIDAALIQSELDIVLSTDDYPHIVYPTANSLRYAVQTPTGWLIETVAPGKPNYASIALDRYGHPHITWYDTVEQDLRYAAFDGSDWQVMTIDSSGNVGLYTSLAVDRLGRVYIAYYDATNQELKYATYDNNTWTITTILSEGDVGSYSKLVMPYAAYPAIAYYDATARDLMLIYRPFEPENFVYLPVFPATALP